MPVFPSHSTRIPEKNMAKEKILAVLDIGSNSTVLLVAKCHPNGHIEPINEVFAITRLGKGISHTGVLSEEAIKFTLDVSKEMQSIAMNEGAEDLIITATSAVRNAKNKSEFLVKCHQKLNIFPQVLSGKEEARFTYIGATYEVESEDPILTIDIGGGSTEVAFGTKNIMVGAHSMNMGCATLSEMFNIGKGEWIPQRIAAKRFIKKNLFSIVDDVHSWLAGRKPVIIASGGTATTFAALVLKENIYDRKHINSVKVDSKMVAVFARQLSRMSIEERNKVPGMEKERAEILPAGLLILSEFLHFFSFKEISITANGLRYGVMKHCLQKYF
jgi:exopolyphosphatase/guanosine-5'-triphosphate,3'-diphosphate pyrophosphatase